MGSPPFRPEDTQLADKLRAVDQTIFGLSLIDSRGQLLSYSPESHFTTKSDSDKESWALTAQRIALLFSMAIGHDNALTPLESIIMIRKEIKEVAVRHPHNWKIAVALVPASINGAILSSKIREQFLKQP